MIISDIPKNLLQTSAFLGHCYFSCYLALVCSETIFVFLFTPFCIDMNLAWADFRHHVLHPWRFLRHNKLVDEMVFCIEQVRLFVSNHLVSSNLAYWAWSTCFGSLFPDWLLVLVELQLRVKGSQNHLLGRSLLTALRSTLAFKVSRRPAVESVLIDQELPLTWRLCHINAMHQALVDWVNIAKFHVIFHFSIWQSGVAGIVPFRDGWYMESFVVLQILGMLIYRGLVLPQWRLLLPSGPDVLFNLQCLFAES